MVQDFAHQSPAVFDAMRRIRRGAPPQGLRLARFTRQRTWLLTVLRAICRAPAAIPPPITDRTAFEVWLAGALARRGFADGVPNDLLGSIGLAETARYDEYGALNAIAHQLALAERLIRRRGINNTGEQHARLLLTICAWYADDAGLIDDAYELLDMPPGEATSKRLNALARATGDALIAREVRVDNPLLNHPFHHLLRHQDAQLFVRLAWLVIEARSALGGRPDSMAMLRAQGLHASAMQHAISATIALLCADGVLDDDERRLMEALIRMARLDATDIDMFEAELLEPVPIAHLAAALSDPIEQRGVMRILLFAANINGDNVPAERAFLETLRLAFGIPLEQYEQYELEALAACQQHAGLFDRLSRRGSIERLRRRFRRRLDDLVRDNAARIWGEVRETSELGQLLLKASTEQLTPAEQEKVNTQLIDLCKAVPALALFAVPGGSVLLPVLAKHLPFNILPSSYLDEQRFEADD